MTFIVAKYNTLWFSMFANRGASMNDGFSYFELNRNIIFKPIDLWQILKNDFF